MRECGNDKELWILKRKIGIIKKILRSMATLQIKIEEGLTIMIINLENGEKQLKNQKKTKKKTKK